MNFRAVDLYFRDTFCKMTQGMASQNVWREVQEAREAADRDLSDILEWANKMVPGWEKTIFVQASKVADELQRQMQLQIEQQIRQGQELGRQKKAAEPVVKSQNDAQAQQLAEQQAKQAAKALIREEEESEKTTKKVGSKKN